MLFALGLVLSVWGGTYCQNTASPFDLIPRIETNEDSIVTISTSSNPFDLVKMSPASRPTTSSQTGFVVEKKDKPLSTKEKTAIYDRFLFVIILAMMVILTLVVTIFRIFISKIWKAFLNDNLLHQLMREQSTGVTVAYSILYLMFFINAGIFLFLLCDYFEVSIATTNFASLMICIGGVMGFFLVKHLLLQIVKGVFPVEKEVSSYSFTITVFNIVVGFFLVPMILLIAYAPDSVTQVMIYTTLGLLVLALLFRSLRGLFIASRFFAWHKFHFFLYLCAVEIAPVVVTVKLLNLQ